MNTIAFMNARLIDPATGYDETGNLLVENDIIADFGPTLFNEGAPSNAQIIECNGNVLCPGLIDMRVFTGEPGAEHRETLGSASQAAAAGGVTSIIVMPNTNPVIDDVALVDFIARRARDTAIVRVHPMAALTKGLRGEEMTEMGLLGEAGAVAFTDGTHYVTHPQIMRRALSYATFFNALIVQHAHEPALVADGVMTEGELATRLGLQGIPKAAEVIAIERDLRLVEITGGRYHVSQVTCIESIEAIRLAKAKGLSVTCGASAAHMTLNENDIGKYLTFCKLDPPLRREEDRQALVEAVADGTIDVVVSGHDPQDPETKRLPFQQAAFGAIGLETLLPATLALVHQEEITLSRLLQTMTSAPADLLGLKVGHLKKGAAADLTVMDINVPWILARDKLKSKSKNSPWDERRMQGRALHTMVGGKIVHSA
ncbi:MAG: dihydroorotase [Parvibaculaceae bacterium]|nr:dihydroorotase [Parvibaculaceae bacterium]